MTSSQSPIFGASSHGQVWDHYLGRAGEGAEGGGGGAGAGAEGDDNNTGNDGRPEPRRRKVLGM